jgi:phosphatidylglycerol:prolipoprotein diacylglycerol transferase
VLIAIDPVLVHVGPLAVRWFGLLALAGLGLAVWGSLRALARAGLPRARALDALAWALPAGLLAARVVHVVGWWDYYLGHAAELWQFNLDGLSLWGGLVGGGLIAFARLRSGRDPRRRRRILDAVAPNLALGIALGRLGAFLDGHGQGVPSELPWATQYTNPLAATPDFGVSRQPAQLYDGLLALALWVVLSRLPSRWPAGSRMAMFGVVYGAARLGLGAVRLDPTFLFGLQLEQLLALGGLACGLAYGVRPLLTTTRPSPLRATLFMTPDCHLCEVTRGHLARLNGRYPHTLDVVDINTDADLVRQYWERIPVLKIGDREYDAPLSPTLLEQALQHAAAAPERATPPATTDARRPVNPEQRPVVAP